MAMPVNLEDWVRSALASSGMKKVELARRLSEKLGHRLDPTALTKMATGNRRMYADELLLISEICNYPLPTSNIDKSKVNEASDEDLLKKEISYSLVRSGVIRNPDEINVLTDQLMFTINKSKSALSRSIVKEDVGIINDLIDRSIQFFMLSTRRRGSEKVIVVSKVRKYMAALEDEILKAEGVGKEKEQKVLSARATLAALQDLVSDDKLEKPGRVAAGEPV